MPTLAATPTRRRTLRTALVGATASALLLLTACETAPMRDSRGGTIQRAPIAAEYGVVRDIQVISVASRPSGAGAILGAVIGGVVGNQFGGGSGRTAATIAGAVGGGVAGNAIENRRRGDDEVYRVTVRFDNGVTREFDFREINDLRTGDRVRLENGQIHLV